MSTTTTDPVADMLTRIRNAGAVRKHEVRMPHSKLKEAIARLLQQNGFVEGVSVEDATVGKTLVVTISNAATSSKITMVKRMSTPGRRMYVGAADIPTIRQGRGIVIVSTSKGVMTGKDAKAQGVGGELVCAVY